MYWITVPHPAMPWAPNNPDRFLSETYGTVIQYIPVPPQQVIIQVPVPLPAGAPAQAQEPPGVPAQSRGERSEEHTSELQSLAYLVCRLLLEKKKKTQAP